MFDRILSRAVDTVRRRWRCWKSGFKENRHELEIRELGSGVSAGDKGNLGVAPSRQFAGLCLFALILLQPLSAGAQGAPATGPSIGDPPEAIHRDQSDDPGEDYLRPTNLFQFESSYRTTPGNGTTPGSIRSVTNDVANFRFDRKIELAPQWTLGLRTDLPLIEKNPINSANPDGNFVRGLGDVDAQAVLLRQFDERWSIGFGARLIAPSGGDLLGAGQWRIMEGGAMRYALPELSSGSYLEPLFRYVASFAGDPTKKNISNLQMAPTFNIGLWDRWYLSLFPSPDIRVNYGDRITGQTGRLFLPFDARIGRKLTENLSISVEAGVPLIKDYPVYNFKTDLRINLQY